jgi:uroporphyrinogen III methyltransferase/synthase
LLTVRARSLLDTCDAIVYDALVAPEMLDGRPQGASAAERHFVGKRGGSDRSARQEDINELLVRLARTGRSVVRLKGGDPFVFGRGGEEADALAAAAIPFEVVPGITAGIAGPAYAGIPVTHRGLSTAVTLVTGSEDPQKDGGQTNWEALARAGGTIVLYMSMARLPAIATALMAGGLDPDTPAAAIEWATRPEQRTVAATLATLHESATRASLAAPVVAVIGHVAQLRERLRWFDLVEQRPLFGRRVLVTRATAQASTLSHELRERGAGVVEMPALRIEPLDPGPLAAALDRLTSYQHIVFTSRNAVDIVWQALRAGGRDARALAGLVVSAIGPATTEALLERGIAVDLTPTRFVAEGLLETLRARADVRAARVLYPAAVDARDVLPDGLRALGATVDVVSVYRSVFDGQGADQVRAAIADREITLVTLTSASAARGFVEGVGPELAASIPAVSIGPVTTQEARSLGLRVVAEAQPSTIPGLVDAVIASVRPA